MNDRVNRAVLRALRREKTFLQEKVYDAHDGLAVRATRMRKRAQEVEDDFRQALESLSEVEKEIARRT